jgi:hypothetical protein
MTMYAERSWEFAGRLPTSSSADVPPVPAATISAFVQVFLITPKSGADPVAAPASAAHAPGSSASATAFAVMVPDARAVTFARMYGQEEPLYASPAGDAPGLVTVARVNHTELSIEPWMSTVALDPAAE